MKNKLIVLVSILLLSSVIGGCTLIGDNNKLDSNSTVNVNYTTTPAISPNGVPTTLNAQMDPESEVTLSPNDDFDSLNSDLDSLDNLEKVGIE